MGNSGNARKELDENLKHDDAPNWLQMNRLADELRFGQVKVGKKGIVGSLPYFFE